MNPRLAKMYQKYPRIRKQGRIIKLTKFEVTKLDQKLIDLYEQRKQEFTKQLNLRLGKSIEKVEATREPEDVGKVIDEVKKNIDDYTKERGGRIFVSLPAILAKFKITNRNAEQVKYIVEKWLEKGTQ